MKENCFKFHPLHLAQKDSNSETELGLKSRFEAISGSRFEVSSLL